MRFACCLCGHALRHTHTRLAMGGGQSAAAAANANSLHADDGPGSQSVRMGMDRGFARGNSMGDEGGRKQYPKSMRAPIGSVMDEVEEDEEEVSSFRPLAGT